MKIVVDAYGGDHSPSEIVKGALLALEAKEDLEVVLVGIEEGVRKELEGKTYDAKRLSIVNASEVISPNEHPVQALKQKKDSSIVRALSLLREDDTVDGFVSAGSTGAVLAGAVLLTKRIPGVNRPALAPILPTVKDGNVILIDCGANVDCKVSNLVQFAIMGSAYMQSVYKIEKPRVALLSNGTEDEKGCALTKETFAELKKLDFINFVGNMEAREMLSGDYDVIVTDGFYGNIALKSVECAVNVIFGELKKEIGSSFKSKMGALLMKGSFMKMKQKMDYNKRGGAVLLGMQKTIVKSHGASKAEAMKNAILQAYNNAGLKINDDIKAMLALMNKEEAQG